MLDRIGTVFGESPLPVSVDVLAYDRIGQAGLKAHIDRVAVPVFSREDLRRLRDHGVAQDP